MKCCLGLVGMSLLAGGAVPAKAQTSVTIYNDGRLLERRVLPNRLPGGSSNHRLALGALDLGSVFALDSGVTITGASYDATTDELSTLRRSIGQRITFVNRHPTGGVDTVVAEVLGTDPERYRLPDGRITFLRPGTALYSSELVQLEPTLTVAVASDQPRSTLGVGFFSAGAPWSANYSVVLGPRNVARITGAAVIGAFPKRIENAEVQLLAGEVGRANKNRMVGDQMLLRASAAPSREVAGEQQVGEAHLYSLPGRLALLPGVETSAMLFEPGTAPFERTFTVTGQLPYWGGLPQYGDESNDPVNVAYVIKRPLKTQFGDRPIPGGTVRIYDRDAQGRPQLIGESSLGHTAAGQDLRLDAGTAFDLTAKRLQTAYETHPEGKRTVATAVYAIVLSNAKDSEATVDVLEQRGGEWSVLQSSIPAEKVSSTITRFRVRVPAKGQATLSYRVRVIW